MTTLNNQSRVATKVVARSGAADYICDGTADNVEINAALTAVAAAGGGKVLLRAGTYTLAASISVPSNVTLEGESFAATLALGAAVNQTLVKNADQTNGNSNIVLRNFSIAGNGSNQTGTSYGVHLKEVTDSLIDNLRIATTRSNGIYLEGESEKKLLGHPVTNCE